MRGIGWLHRSPRTEMHKQEVGEATQEIATVRKNGGGRSPKEEGTTVGLSGGS